MKLKIFAFASFVLSFVLLVPFLFQGDVSFADENYVQVVASECCVYQEASFDNPIKDSGDNLIKLKHGQLLRVIEGEKDYFIKVEYEGYEEGVFVYARYVTYNVMEQEVYPIFNAEVAVEKAIVYDLDENPTNIVLEEGKEIYLYEGYKKSSEKTAVCFVDENGKLYYGYLNTSDLSPYGINAGVITGIMVAVSCVTIILLLLFIKKKKKVKKAE